MIDHQLLIELLKCGISESAYLLLLDRINLINSSYEKDLCLIITKYVDNLDNVYFLDKDFSLSSKV
jgi:hypothetical protein